MNYTSILVSTTVRVVSAGRKCVYGTSVAREGLRLSPVLLALLVLMHLDFGRVTFSFTLQCALLSNTAGNSVLSIRCVFYSRPWPGPVCFIASLEGSGHAM